MPEDGQYGRNMQHMFTGLITFVVADDRKFFQYATPRPDEVCKNKVLYKTEFQYHLANQNFQMKYPGIKPKYSVS